MTLCICAPYFDLLYVITVYVRSLVNRFHCTISGLYKFSTDLYIYLSTRVHCVRAYNYSMLVIVEFIISIGVIVGLVLLKGIVAVKYRLLL